MMIYIKRRKIKEIKKGKKTNTEKEKKQGKKTRKKTEKKTQRGANKNKKKQRIQKKKQNRKETKQPCKNQHLAICFRTFCGNLCSKFEPKFLKTQISHPKKNYTENFPKKKFDQI